MAMLVYLIENGRLVRRASLVAPPATPGTDPVDPDAPPAADPPPAP